MKESTRKMLLNKKRVFDAELAPIGSALGLTIEYKVTEIGERGYIEELVIDGGKRVIPVNMDSTEAMKKDFIFGLADMVTKHQLPWIYKGEAV